MSKNFNRERSNGIAQGREDSRWMRERIAELEAERAELVGALEFALAESEEPEPIFTWKENARKTLAKIDAQQQEKGNG